MKKIIMVFIGIILFLFISILVMVFFDNRYINDLEKDIKKNTDIDKIEYVNKYDNNYIVSDSRYVYLFDSNYKEIYRLEIGKLYDNRNDYDIVYRDNTMMYMDNYKSEDEIIFKYYDIYTYELIDTIVVGGN